MFTRDRIMCNGDDICMARCNFRKQKQVFGCPLDCSFKNPDKLLHAFPLFQSQLLFGFAVTILAELNSLGLHKRYFNRI